MNFNKIANILAAINAGAMNKEGHKALRVANSSTNEAEVNCANVAADAMCCVHANGNNKFAACDDCMNALFEDVPWEGDVCAYLFKNEETFCPALYQCMHADNCNYGACWTEIDAFFDCDADEEDSCPGLCEDYDVKSSFVTA